LDGMCVRPPQCTPIFAKSAPSCRLINGIRKNKWADMLIEKMKEEGR